MRTEPQPPAFLPPGPPRFSPRDWLRWIRQPIEFLERAKRSWGDSFTLPALPWPSPRRGKMVWLGEPEAIRDVFAGDPDALHAGEANFIVEGILGSHSLLMLDGEAHRRERKLMMPPFHGERMRAYGQAMRDITASAIAGWPLGEPFALLQAMQAITLEVILRTVFGIEEGPRLARLRDLLRGLLVVASSRVVFGAALLLGSARMRDLISAGSQPIALGPWSLRLGPLLPGHRLYELMTEVDALLHAEFVRRRAGGPMGEDILSMLLAGALPPVGSRSSEGSAARDEAGEPMTDAELRDEMMTLLVAGHETTATSLAWAFHHLLANPAALDRLRAEVATAGSREPDAVAGLDYLDAVVKETMRLTPVVPLVARIAKRDLTIGRYRVPAGTMVMPNVYLVHHRADLWPEPERFRPERFLERKPGPHEFFPFGGGVRRCLGAAFATYEMKIVIAEVIARTRLEALDARVTLERRGIMFAPSGGTRVALRARW